MVQITRRKLLRLAAAGVCSCASGAFYGFRIEPTWLRIVDVDVPIQGLHPALEGYTIVQLSDLHVGAGVPREYLEDAVAAAVGIKSDLIAITGDFVHTGGSPSDVKEVGEILAPLRAPDGVVACDGNHDRGVYFADAPPNKQGEENFRLLRRKLEATGIRLLENESCIVQRGQGRLRVAGLGDLWGRAFDPAAAGLDEPGPPTVVLSHNPDTMDRLTNRFCDLVLSGHTHGGQVSIPFLGPPVLPVFNREHYAGLYHIDGQWLYVNRGLGWIRRVRLFVRPEVTVLRLVSPKA